MRHPAAIVRPVAAQLVKLFAPACDRVEIAGSLRRGSETVKDIEIVAQPRLVQPLNLFGEPAGPSFSDLDPLLDDLVDADVLARADKNGDRYKSFVVCRFDHTYQEPVKLDLFIVRPPAQFGAILAIRTGPETFSRKLVTPRSKGGLLPSHLVQKGGGVWDGDQLIETPTERAYFELLGLDWIEPEARR